MEFQPMSPEEIQRTMQFLLTHQAQFAADLGKLTDGLTTVTAHLERLTDGMIGLTGIVGHLAANQDRTDQQIRELRDMFDRHLRDDHGYGRA